MAAWPSARPRGVAPPYRPAADSIEVEIPRSRSVELRHGQRRWRAGRCRTRRRGARSGGWSEGDTRRGRGGGAPPWPASSLLSICANGGLPALFQMVAGSSFPTNLVWRRHPAHPSAAMGLAAASCQLRRALPPPDGVRRRRAGHLPALMGATGALRVGRWLALGLWAPRPPALGELVGGSCAGEGREREMGDVGGIHLGPTSHTSAASVKPLRNHLEMIEYFVWF